MGETALMLPPPPVLVESAKHCTKFAVMLAALAGMVKVSAVEVEADAPLHVVKTQLELADAVTLTEADA